MVPVIKAELVVEYGRERRLLGSTDHPLYTRSLANQISGDVLDTLEMLDGIDDALADEARSEAKRLRKLIAELLPTAACAEELRTYDLDG